ncbi:magnesium chelatase subunit D [Methanomicrobium sp. W14]|uniref:putative cobaltochelatase n=1 Tax=Methanomicrobium sp. W14 TaxID=2817839 RepID=UPI001AE93912|nr:putative cobaltochelatase [Methanomicrobium sp. W14]MBP2134386.1 magnesium chelatase subunit D [Methanomicrobium sp. W14]
MQSSARRSILPFTAIIGQETMKKALVLNAVNPKIGGVLIRGDKGTAKSTAVRALAEVLPEITVSAGCPYSCNPENEKEMCDFCRSKKEKPKPFKRKVRVAELPLGATEDRVLGTIDIEKAIKEGEKRIEPGILADANRGILYVDEINLLDDHIADILLDAAAMGVNVVEREGISLSHPSSFILIGTMNPEEGELRPQLLDRFGLQVAVEGIEDIESRLKIARTAESFEKDPEEFAGEYEVKQDELRERIKDAVEILPFVAISDGQIRKIAEVCLNCGITTHRAEIAVMRTAKAIAALDKRGEVSDSDIKEAMQLALPHRMRKKPFEEPKLDNDMINEVMDEKNESEKEKEEQDKKSEKPSETPKNTGENEIGEDEPKDKQKSPKGGNGSPSGNDEGDAPDVTYAIGRPVDTSKISSSVKKDKIRRKNVSGRRTESETTSKRGSYRGFRISGEPSDIAFDATIRAAAPFQKEREKKNFAISIAESDLREKKRAGKTSAACMFVVDASGSMGAKKRMESTKGAILSMLNDSYKKRDKIGLVAFRGDSAEVILPLCSSVDLAKKCLEELPTGGRTPLYAGLSKGMDVLMQEKRKNGDIVPLLVCISDGRSNKSVSGDIKKELMAVSEEIFRNDIHTVLIDTETSGSGFLKMQLGYCKMVAEHSKGSYYSLDDLGFQEVSGIASAEISRFT